MFIQHLEAWIVNNTERLAKENIKIEHVLNYEGKKLELGLSNIYNNNGGSVELLKNGTCDSMIIDFKTDETVFFNTIVFINVDELSEFINDFVIKLAKKS